MTDLIVVGDALVDVASSAPALREGGDVRGSVHVRAGGQGANVAVWAASQGLDTRLISRVGDDDPGRMLRERLESRGVGADLAVDSEATTGVLLVSVAGDVRSMIADRGAAAQIAPDDLPEPLEARAVLVSGYLLFDESSEPAALAALERASCEHLAVEASTWPLLEEYGPDRFLEATAPATILFANEREAEVLAGGDDASRKLAERYEIVCVKRGADGAAVASGEVVLQTPARETAVVDPTGAGDAFDAAFLATLLRGKALGRALDHAVTTGSWVVGREDSWP